MSVRRLAVLALSAATSLTAQYSYYLPQVSDGNVANGSMKTTLMVANVAKTAANLKITVTRDDSTAVPLTFSGLGTGTSLSTRLVAGATRVWTTDGRGDGNPGAAVITSDAPLRVSAIVSNTSSSGDVLNESAVIALAKEDLSVNYMAAIDTTAGFDTGIALYNPATATAQITLRLRDGTGVQLNSTVLTLRANGRVTFLGSRLAGVGSEFRGTLDVTSSVPLAAVSVRQNPSSPVYTLLPAPDRTSLGLFFYLPRIVDGQSDSGTTQTTFLFTNVSAKPVSVQIALTLDDGTPFTASIAGAGTGQEFQTTIPPGATIFWQTDGSSEELTTGAATIKSDHPISVAALITSSDASGAFLSETGVAPAGQNFQFLIPFEDARDTATGATFLNVAGQDLNLTLDLLDPDGKLIASTRPAPIAGGARVTGMVSDFFPNAPAGGSIRISTGLRPFLVALAVRQSASGKVLSSNPALILPWTPTGTPTTVRPTLDASRKATASIGPTGGTLTVTDAKGNRFTLTIPPQALLSHQTIIMTAVTSATGFSGPGFAAGVQLEPDGLVLFRPALLKIDMAGPVPDGAVPIGWRGDQPGIYSNAPLPTPNSLTLMLHHFSGAGLGGADVTQILVAKASLMEIITEVMAEVLTENRQLQLLGSDQADSPQRLDIKNTLKFGYEFGILPLIKLALSSDDTDLMLCVYQHALEFDHQRQFLGLSTGGSCEGRTGSQGPIPESDTVGCITQEYLIQLLDLRLAKLRERCKNHDFTVYYDLLNAHREAVSNGITAELNPDELADVINQCAPKLQLDYQSEMIVTVPVPAFGGFTESFDGTIQGSLVANGTFTKNKLTQVLDSTKDLDLSFEVTGAAKEKYPTARLTVSQPPIYPCQVSVRNTTTQPSTITIRPSSRDKISQVQFMFDPRYNPIALTVGGQQLCSFCPVFRKKPIGVELFIDPGDPSETSDWVCSTSTLKMATRLWTIGWDQFHLIDSGFIGDWDLINTDALLAQKSLTRTVSVPGLGGVGNVMAIEKTTFMLKPCTGPVDPTGSTCINKP